MILYHVTKLSNIPSIRERGLIVGHTYSEGPFFPFAQDPTSIWFFAFERDAIEFVDDEEGWALVVVDVPGNIVTDWKGGPDERWKFVSGNVSPNRIVRVVHL